jgi:2,3-bisphosphoglycerate-dependent phosphoglycerate mutase
MAIFLIRHGETASNASRVVQTVETPLSDRGMVQAKRLAQRLAGENICEIWCSDLCRARMTAEPLQLASGAPLRTDARLQERNYGDIRGMAYADIGADILAPDYDPPGGEPWNVFHARVDAVWGDIARAVQDATGDLAIVTHGLVCHSLALHHLRLPPAVVPPRRWANTGVTVIDARPPWFVQVLNCTAHLDLGAADDSSAPSGT